jgi:hypothetical protein
VVALEGKKERKTKGKKKKKKIPKTSAQYWV